MSKVAIWMGHSGAEMGANGILLEDNVTRQARTWAVAYAKACGHSVTTDADNMSLSQRINASTADHAGVLEWHANLLGTGAAHGTEVWYSQHDSGKGQAIAKTMSACGPKYDFTDRGAKNSSTNRYGRLGILDTPKPTAVLVELFFLDNAEDVSNWQKNGKAFVEAMTASFLSGLGLKSTPSGATPSQSTPAVPAPSKPAQSGGYEVKAWNKKQVVDVDILNVRTTATSASKLVRQLKKGQTFTATRIITNGERVGNYTSWFEADGWGWVSGAYVTQIKAAAAAPSTPKLKGSSLPNSGRYTFTANTNIRSNASTGSSVVGLYSKGQSVIYDSKVTAGGYVWLSYIGASGNRRYVAVV